MQKQKNIRLIVVLAMVLSAIILLPYIKNKKNGLQINKRAFTLDPQTVITDVVLKSDSNLTKLSYTNGQWMVNNTYPLDINMRDVFFSVLSQMELRRAVPTNESETILELLNTKGTEVVITNNADTIRHYVVAGDSQSQNSYIMGRDHRPYVLHIPGYRSFVAGIFMVPEPDWRTRRVFSANFTNLSALSELSAKDTLTFSYNQGFYEIEGLEADSTQLINTLENLLFIQTDQYLQPKEANKYHPDSLLKTDPLGIISCTKISGTTEKLTVFNTHNNTYYFCTSPDSSFCIINKKRFDKIWAKREDFE